MHISTRKLVLTAVLAAISLALSGTFGLIPVPNISGGATIMHLPPIIGGIFIGPLSGSILGLILAFSTLPLFISLGVNLAACFIPRLLIGVVAYAVWLKLGKGGFAVVAAALAGTFVNTMGVLGIAVLAGNYTWAVITPIIALNGTLELIVSAVVVLPIVRVLEKVGGLNDVTGH